MTQEAGSATLADRFRMLLERAGDSKARAQRRTGLGYATVHGILAGQRRAPDAATLRRIADGYGVSVEWLLGGDSGYPAPDSPAAGWPDDPVSRLKHAFSHPATLVAHPEYREPRALARAVARRAAEEGLSPEEIADLVEWSMRDDR